LKEKMKYLHLIIDKGVKFSYIIIDIIIDNIRKYYYRRE